MTDLLLRDVPDSPTVKACPNCAKTNWVHTYMGEGHDRIECHECGLVLWGLVGLFTDESALKAWNLLHTTRSDLALAAQGALLEQAAALLDQYEGAPCLPLDEGAWTDELTTFYNFGQKDATNAWKQQIRALSPDATAALAEREAKVRNDALREVKAVVEDWSHENLECFYDGLNNAIEALITTEEQDQ